MSKIENNNETIPVKDAKISEISPSKDFIIGSKGNKYQKNEIPWHLFPEEDIDDLSTGSESDCTSSSSSDEDETKGKKDDHIGESASIAKSNKKLYACAVCGKKYKKKGHLDRHKLKHFEGENGELPQLKCDQCSYQATRLGNLKKHMLTHSGERPFSCNQCGKSFRQKTHLKGHLRSHSGEREFECNVCGATFVQKSSMKIHEKKHSGVRPYACHLCEWSFFESQHLANHLRTHTGERPFQCETCGQTFSAFRTMKIHKMIHTGERPYKCEVCGVCFREKASYQRHKGVHINVGPFPCNECGKEYSRLASLTLHKKIHLPLNSNIPLQNGITNSSNEVFKPKMENVSSFILENEKQEHSQAGNFSVVSSLHDSHNGIVYKPSESLGSFEVTGNEKIAVEKGSLQASNHTEEILQPNSLCIADSDVITASFFKEGKSEESKASDRILFSSLETQGEIIINDLHNSDLVKVEKNAIDCISPRKNMVSLENIPKIPGNITSSMGNIAHPDHVRQALEFGTVVETKDEQGNDFIIVLPAILSNQDIILASQTSDSILPLKNCRPSPEKFTPIISNIKNNYEDEFPKVVGSEISLSTRATRAYEGSNRKEKRMKECELGLDGNDHSTGQSSDEGNLDIEIFASAAVDEDPLNVRDEGFGGKMIQEDIHSESTGLLLWDEGVDPVTEVTYVIQEGQKEPVSIFHTTGQAESMKIIPLNADHKTASLIVNDSDCIVPEMIPVSSPKKRKRGISHEEKRRVPRKMKEKREKSQPVRECKQCGKICRSSSNLISHMRTHSGERPYYCDVCGVGFKQIAHLRSHVRIHTGEKPYVCDICGAAFTQSSRLNSHKKNKHVEGKKPKLKNVSDCKVRNFYCRICKKTFIDQCFKRDHMEEHKSMGDMLKISKIPTEFQCDVCGIVYKNKATFNKHRLLHSDNKVICEVCGHSFASISSLQSHSMTVHGVKVEADSAPGMYINVKIGKEQDFIVVNPSVKNILHDNKPSLSERETVIKFEDDFEENQKIPVIHLTETVDGQVESEVMPEAEYSSEETTGMKVVHVNKGIKDEPITAVDSDPFDSKKIDSSIGQSGSCKTPDTNDFQSEGNVLDINVPNIKKPRLKFDYVDSEGRKVWQCKMCPKVFYQSSNLHCHMRSHTGEKPYKCNLCASAFKQITHLKEHMHKHTGMKSFGCSICGAHFTQRSAVRRHMNALHNGEGVIEKVKSFSALKENPTKTGSLYVRSRSCRIKDDSELGKSKLKSCEVCGKEYSASYLKSHQRCHTGERPFKCNYCKLSFRQKAHLKTHLVCHNGEGPYVCKMCGTSFSKSVKLRKHKDACIGKGIRIKRIISFHKGKARKKEKETENDVESLSHDKLDTDENETIGLKKVSLAEPSQSDNQENLEESSNSSLSDSEISDGSDDIPYDDESDVDIELPRKFLGKRLEKTRVEEFPSAEDNRADKISKNNAIEDCEYTEGNLDIGIVCKLCGAQFKRVSAYNFHHKMKHEHGNDDESEEDADEYKRMSIYIRGVQKGRKPAISVKRVKTYIDKGETGVKEEAEATGKFETKPDISLPKKGRSTNKKTINRVRVRKTEKIRTPIPSPCDELDKKIGVSYMCTVCNLSFSKSSLLDNHIECEHKLASKGAVVETAVSMQQTQENIAPAKMNFLGALDLADNFEDGLLQRDSGSRLSIGKEENKSYVCDACGKSFSRSSKLKHHVSMWCKGKTYSTEIIGSVIPEPSRRNKRIICKTPEQIRKKKDEDRISKDSAKKQDPPDPLTLVEAVIKDTSKKITSKQLKIKAKQDSDIKEPCVVSGGGLESSCINEVLAKNSKGFFTCSKCKVTFKHKTRLVAHLKKHKKENVASS